MVRRAAGAKPFIVGIAGRSGVGKSTLARMIAARLASTGSDVITLGVDDFFRYPHERRRLGEWGPEHIRLAEARRVLGEIAARNPSIDTLQYRRVPSKGLYPWRIDASSIDVALFEGLYAISDEDRLGGFIDFVDFAVFLDATEEDTKKWRFEQEQKKPVCKTDREMEKHWTDGIVPDTAKNVMPSWKNADIVVTVDGERRVSIASER